VIDPKTLEHEYDPYQGCFGRAYGTFPAPPGWGGYWPPVQPATTGIKPEDVDLSAYNRFLLDGRQSEFPVHANDGGITNIRMRIWVREEDGRHYCIVFEDRIM
jgi:hypothetical protein